jgi:hypothetical protein
MCMHTMRMLYRSLIQHQRLQLLFKGNNVHIHMRAIKPRANERG